MFVKNSKGDPQTKNIGYLSELKDPSVSERTVRNFDHANGFWWRVVAIGRSPLVTVWAKEKRNYFMKIF